MYIKKIKDKLSKSHCTFANILLTKTASDWSLTYFRLFQKMSYFGPTCLTKMKSTKITFECFFLAQNPLQTILGLQNFWNFFLKNLKFLYVSTPYTAREKK